MKITKANYPTIYEAFSHISHDNDISFSDERWDVPKEHVADLPKIEAALQSLTAVDLETFCIGEYDDQLALQKKHPHLPKTSKFLNLFFEAWGDYE